MPAESTPSNLDDAVRIYESGESLSEAERRTGVPRKTIRQAIEDRGTFRIPVIPTLPADEIIATYSAGTSENRLATEYGVTRHRIAQILTENGIPRRGVTNANRLMMTDRSPQENRRNTQAAHDAVRGVKWTADRIAAAKGRQPSREAQELGARTRHGRIPSHAGELLYAAWLRLRGYDVIHQHAVGPYNCDLTVGTVAVEIFGGHWHGYGYHARVFAERSRYILDQGWNMVFVWVNEPNGLLSEASADYIAAFIEETRSDPSIRGQYRVVWGDGKEVPTAGRNLDEFAVRPSYGRSKNAG